MPCKGPRRRLRFRSSSTSLALRRPLSRNESARALSLGPAVSRRSAKARASSTAVNSLAMSRRFSSTAVEKKTSSLKFAMARSRFEDEGRFGGHGHLAAGERLGLLEARIDGLAAVIG